MSDVKLFNGDCLEIMPKLADEGVKVDLVLTDVPYGTTSCKWDNIIPFDEMWDCLDKLTYDNTPIVLFGSEPFSSNLRMSNIKNYKYDWIWDKGFCSNFTVAKYQPMCPYEIISVFYKKQCNYYPIKWQQTKKELVRDRAKTSRNLSVGVAEKYEYEYKDDGTRYPLRIIKISGLGNETQKGKRVHPTQKPISLLKYLIKTYTKEDEVVLDFTMGSGSTGVACLQTNRNFIGIELEPKYYEIAKERIKEAKAQRRLI